MSGSGRTGRVFVGTAGWSLPAAERDAFPDAGTHLERYAARFGAVEINSSFYRPHRPATYARWRESVPDAFRFAVKIPRLVTHELRLRDADSAIDRFLDEASHLGDKLGCLLVQLPPSLACDPEIADEFFAGLRQRVDAGIACEPRHVSWFTPPVDNLFVRHRIARVAADPAPVPGADLPAGWPDLVYRRLHGSPRIYYSAYEDETVDAIADALRADEAAGRESWCIYDNTALGAATRNALDTIERIRTVA